MRADLAAPWRNDAADPQGRLVALTTYFNTAIVRSVLARVGRACRLQRRGGYSLLTTDDTPAAEEPAVRTWLDDHGIDRDALCDDFVTHRNMHRYLRDERGLEVPIPLR